MATETQEVSPYQRSSQTFERRRSLFPQNSVDSDEDSDLGCMSPLSSSSIEEDEYLTNGNANNINDYDVIGIVKRDINSTPEVTPDKDGINMSEESVATTPHYNNLASFSRSPSESTKSLNPPKYILKTPHDTMSGNSKVPKLIHKSVTDSSISAPSKRKLSPYNSPELLDKSLKLDIKNSKVRTSLFSEPDLFIPTKKFYSNSDSSMELNQEPRKESPRGPVKPKMCLPCSFLTARKKYSSKRNSVGKINAGVKHKIRKPRQKKNSSMSLQQSSMNEAQSNALKNYLLNLKELKSVSSKQILFDNKENDHPAISTISATSMNFSPICNPVSDKYLPEEINPRNSDQVVLTNIENAPCTSQTAINNNQFSTNVSYSNKTCTNQAFTNPFTISFSKTSQHSIPTPVEDEPTKKRPLSPTLEEPDQSKKFFKFSRGHKGVVTMNKSMKLMVDHGKVSLLGGSNLKKPEQKVPDFDKDFVIEEPIMSQVVLDNIISALDDENQNDVNESQKMKTVIEKNSNQLSAYSNSNFLNSSSMCQSVLSASLNPANLILSPISQMCDVTSGLALNSPKRVKNLTPLMENVSRNTKALSPPKSKTTKSLTLTQRKIKKLHKDQMLLDAGQKKFGVTQCHECNFVYHMGDPSDEACHMNYHEAVPVLKFVVSY